MKRGTDVVLTIILLLAAPGIDAYGGDPFNKVATAVKETNRALFSRKAPGAPRDPSVENLAKEIDWLEHIIECYGSVVPKQPDVWGEARLTKFRWQYENELSKRFDSDKFQETLQAAVRHSDEAALSLAFALNAASGGAAKPTSNAAVALIPSLNGANSTDTIVQRTPPAPLDLKNFATNQVSLEPTIVSDQLDRYLNHLAELRRINEGDDTADSPGYALNLIRIPVSVLPGHDTRQAHGAEITFSIEPYLSDNLLPATIRDLVVNDISDLLSLPLAQLFNNDTTAASKLIQAYWMQRAHVERWIEAYDAVVEMAQIAGVSELDIACLYSLRPYLHWRFVQIADQAWREGQRDLTRLGHSRPTPQAAAANACPNPDCVEDCDEVSVCPLYQYALPLTEILPADMLNLKELAPIREAIVGAGGDGSQSPFLLVQVQPGQMVKALDELSANVMNGRTAILAELAAKPAVQTKIRQMMNGYLHFHLNVDVDDVHDAATLTIAFDLSKYQPGDFVDRMLLPFSVSDFDSPKLSQVIKQFKPAAAENLPAPPQAAAEGFSEPARALWDAFSTAADFQALWQKVKMAVIHRLNEIVRNIAYNNSVSRHLDNVAKGNVAGFFDCWSFGGATATVSGTASRPLAPSQILPAYGFDGFMDIAEEAYSSLRTNAANLPYVHEHDCRQYLQLEIDAAYNFLENRESQPLWVEFCVPELADAIDGGNIGVVTRMREAFKTRIGGSLKHRIAGALAWAIIVDAARLNSRLIEDMRDTATAKGCGCAIAHEGLRLTYPDALLAPEAREAFRQYVRCRWPVIVFALDPVTDDQNVADIYSRRRELQLAVAVAVANGNVSPSAAGRFVRRTEMDSETIALNRTAVAFSHGNDTCGWRFYPRVQSPDTPGGLTAFAQTFTGGPNRDHELRDRQLEPGIRDCSVIVIMPSFVPYVTITSRSNWFCVTNPRNKLLTLHDTMRISRNYMAIHAALRQTCDFGTYRPSDVRNLGQALTQLERRMPLQSAQVEAPILNTLGGFELFQAGEKSLGPVVEGYYGAPGIDPNGVTTLYLVGRKFNVHETRVIAGGRQTPFRMLSRKVLEIVVPPGVQALNDPNFRDRVDIQVAAPYGVSSHTLVPLVTRPNLAAGPNSFTWSTANSSVDIWYGAGTPATPKRVSATAMPAIQMSSPTLAAATTLPLTISINEVNGASETLLTTVTGLNARLDVRTQRYVIDGDPFNTLATNLITAATNRFALTPPTSGATSRWLLRASFGSAGTLVEPVLGAMVLDVTFRQIP